MTVARALTILNDPRNQTERSDERRPSRAAAAHGTARFYTVADAEAALAWLDVAIPLAQALVARDDAAARS